MEKQSEGVRVLSETGSEMMTMKSFRRHGDFFVIRGALMGAWDADMYMTPPAMLNAIKLAMKPEVIGYVLSLPFLLLRGSKKKKTTKA